MRNRHPAIACPYPAPISGPQPGPECRPSRHQHPASRAAEYRAPRTLADLAQTATAFPGRLEIEVAAVLDRQNMPALAARRMRRPPAIEQRRNRHARIGQKARESDKPTASASRQAPEADARAPPFPRSADPRFCQALISEIAQPQGRRSHHQPPASQGRTTESCNTKPVKRTVKTKPDDVCIP